MGGMVVSFALHKVLTLFAVSGSKPCLLGFCELLGEFPLPFLVPLLLLELPFPLVI